MSQKVREIATRVLKYQEQIGDIEALAGHVLASTEPLAHGVARDKLAHLRSLKPGWDSYGGKPISTESLSVADYILTTPGQPVPCSDGGVQIEWHVGGVDVEICIGPDGKIVEDASTEPLKKPLSLNRMSAKAHLEGTLRACLAENNDLRAQLQAAQQSLARESEFIAGLTEEWRALQQLADERGREVERLRADFEKLGDWISPDIEAKRECTMSAGALNQMRKIYRSMREVLATSAATPPAHVYTSTACQHGLHDRCRKACKFCGTPCLCPCGHFDTSAAEFHITPEEAIEYATDEEIGEIPRPNITPAQEHPDTAIEWRISYEYCQGGLLGTQHEEWDAFSATVANKEICAEFVAEITDKMHRNIRIESRGPWVDAVRTAPEAQR